MPKTIIVGCRLPHGLILDHPLDPEKKVELNGKNKARIIGSDYGTTEVDADFWEQWSTVHKDFPALKSGAIFTAKNEADAVAVAAEVKDETTGFEPMPQEAQGVKPADKE